MGSGLRVKASHGAGNDCAFRRHGREEHRAHSSGGRSRDDRSRDHRRGGRTDDDRRQWCEAWDWGQA